MPVTKATKVFNNFTKGLITEAEALNFPADASFDELNMNVAVTGLRRRRLGMDIEASGILSTPTFTDTAIGDSQAVSSGEWTVVGGDAGINFVVVQIGNTLHFYDGADETVSTNAKSFTVDLTTHQSATNPGQIPVSFDSGKGVLFVANERLNTFYIEYDATGDTISSTSIALEIRDFDGVDDTLANDEQPATLSNLHKYNLLNQTWSWQDKARAETFAMDNYFANTGFYPSNAQVMHVGVDIGDSNSDGKDFQFEWMIQTAFGNSLAPKGHYILDPFNKDRSTVSGIAGIPVETIAARPSSVAFYSGRAWYGGTKGNVYFSQIIQDNFLNVGKCYQEADPTAKDLNELVDTDGGVVSIPEAGKIISVREAGSSLIVIASNGVWSISGTDGGFKATDFKTTFIGKIGALDSRGVALLEDVPVWWAEEGIYSLQSDQVTQNLSLTNLTENTIQSFYDAIPATSKANVVGKYDSLNKRMIWLYKSDEDDNFNKYTYDSVLILDLKTGAFLPWTIEKLGASSPYVVGLVGTAGKNTTATEETVTDGGADVTDSGVDVTDSGSFTSLASASFLKYVVLVPNGASSKHTFGGFIDETFYDWRSTDGAGVSYSSYLITGYDTQGDPMLIKQTPTVFSYFKRTEQGFTGDEINGYLFDKPSSCIMQARWEWTSTGSASRWSAEQQAYRLSRAFTVPDDLSFDYDFTVVLSRTRLRGKGRAVQFRFSSEEGKDMQFLGWGVEYLGLTAV